MKKLFKSIFAFIGAVAFFYFLHRAQFTENISPFAISIIFSIFSMGKNNIWLLFSYFLAGILSHLTPLGIIEIVIQVMLIFGLILVKRLLRTKKCLSIIFGFGLVLSQMPAIFFYHLKEIALLNYLISIVLSILFFYLFIRLISAVKYRGIKTTFTLDEMFGIFILVIGLSLGAGAIKFQTINFALITTLLMLLVLSKLNSIYPTMFYAVASGVAFMLANNEYNYFVIFIAWALTLILFKDSHRLLSSIMLIICDLLLGLVFKVYNDYSLINFVAVALLGILYICMPRRVVKRFKSRLEIIHPEAGQLDEVFRQSVKNKMSTFVNLLYDIDSIYKDMVIPLSTFNKSKSYLAKDVCKRVCKDCINRKTCYDKNVSSIENSVEKTLEIGIKKGEVKVVDMPTNLARCSNFGLLVGNINQASKRYLGLVREANAGNLGKITIGNQLKGVADCLKDFSSSLIVEIRAERTLERNYLGELLYNDITAEDCQIILEGSGELKSVSVLLKMTTDRNKFLNVTQKFFKSNLKISESRYSGDSGWQIVTLVKKPKYGFVFGSATIGHNGKIVNGDSHSCIKLEGERYLLSIADGKGHGKSAEKTSNLTMALIEKFFKANISTDTIVSSVNQILSFNSNENFSAVDLCIVDLNDGRADFVKLGSTPTLIKRGEKVRAISGSGLPIGVSNMATSSYDAEYLSVGDIIVMTSDGVFDGFETIENFAGFVNNVRILNMDMLAKSLLEESIKLSGGKIRDDLTVVAFRWLVDF